MNNKQEQIDFAKRRALLYVEHGRLSEALSSIYSDLKGHPETRNHPAIHQGFMLQMQGRLETENQIRLFIQEFLV